MEQAGLERKERERQAAEQARLEEERSLAAVQKARVEQEGRERKAAAEKARADQIKRERHEIGRARREQEERKKPAEKTNEQPACAMTEDQLDETREAERQKRQNELTKALVGEWPSHGSVHRNIEETELIKTLRAALSEWQSKRPPGFENRQSTRQEQQEAETRRAIDS